MIQRVQSLYLLAAVLLWSLLFFVPVLIFDGGGFSLRVFISSAELARSDGSAIETPFTFLPMLSLALAISTASVAIFLFKKRRIQWVVSAMAGVFGLAFFILWGLEMRQALSAVMTDYPELKLSALRSLGLMLPVTSVLFIWAAMRGIRKDENLVKSLDRIR
jgi:hypothetical protein